MICMLTVWFTFLHVYRFLPQSSFSSSFYDYDGLITSTNRVWLIWGLVRSNYNLTVFALCLIIVCWSLHECEEMMEDRGDQISGTAYGFLILGWITTLLRCYCRIAVVKCFGSDDWLAVFATVGASSSNSGFPRYWLQTFQVFYTVYCAFSIEATYYGSGMPTDKIPLQDLPKGLMVGAICCFFILSWSDGINSTGGFASQFTL